MAVQTGHAIVLVACHIIVFTVHPRLVVLMAAQAGKNGIITGVLVAIRATVPLAPVRTRVDGEVLVIVNLKIGRAPAGVRRMAQNAVR